MHPEWLRGVRCWSAFARACAVCRKGSPVGRVLVTIPTRDVDGEAVQEALALLGPEHELIFLTVHPIPAGIADDGIGAPMVLSEETWDELGEGARELGGRELRETLDKLGL